MYVNLDGGIYYHAVMYSRIRQTVLTATKWREYLKPFENNVMEIYETIGTVLVPQEEER